VVFVITTQGDKQGRPSYRSISKYKHRWSIPLSLQIHPLRRRTQTIGQSSNKYIVNHNSTVEF